MNICKAPKTVDGTQRYADVCYTVTVLIVEYIESLENISPLPLPSENMLHFPYISTQFIDNTQKEIHMTRLWSNWSLV